MSKTSIKNSWKKTLNLVKDYFMNSEEKLLAWLLLIGTILCVVGLVALVSVLSWWSAGFWAVLTAKALTPFLISMGQFVLILGALVSVHVLKNYLIGKLSIHWRSWLTKKIMNELFGSENNYLDLKRFSSEIDNLGQRIQEDIKAFVELTLRLGTDFLKSILSLGTFVGTLWVVGGALTVTLLGLNIIIPGYLVWVALIVAVVATLAAHFIGKSLPEASKATEKAEADFRQDLAELNHEAENIAEEHAENFYQSSLERRVQEIKTTATKKLDTQTKLVAFQSFYSQLGFILPNILAAPLYFSGLIEIGQLMQIGMSFAEVNLSFSWFVEAYENIATYKASIERISELRNTFEKEGLAANPKSIVRKKRDKESLNIKRLNIMPPQASSTEYIMRNLNLKLKPGEHILIKGDSGLGKSTLFKAISGTWGYGDGKISLPAGKHLYFLPQKPTLPHTSLKAVLAYPEPTETYTEEEYINALLIVGKMDAFIPRLDESLPWSEELSAGQQQRIAFARALLKRPDWLFLDEATSALDENGEEHVYNLVKQQLKETTIVSIGHRSTVEKHHARIVDFHANKAKEIEIEEKRLLL
ncbi:ABC transporter ATP-binding protein/permease [Legionella maceachernii]|uniref:ABC transporter n=1 Tax=Legionella maceachernii TaxID=466 RepID=A0A0W0WHY1_9GAMM|nr:ABC transporter ATP-binding protein/permease [Legionella maceachernii]KTD31964.1 ABC transporter [Legionella maceachernii]SKA24070.1 putative ATP-binding cassette transporter [Legionella maceachernii]SUP04234.1 CDS102 [Legionella maceachernii]